MLNDRPPHGFGGERRFTASGLRCSSQSGTVQSVCVCVPYRPDHCASLPAAPWSPVLVEEISDDLNVVLKTSPPSAFDSCQQPLILHLPATDMISFNQDFIWEIPGVPRPIECPPIRPRPRPPPPGPYPGSYYCELLSTCADADDRKHCSPSNEHTPKHYHPVTHLHNSLL